MYGLQNILIHFSYILSKQRCSLWRAAVTTLPQEEDLQEIVTKISSKRVEYDQVRAQMAEHKAAYEKADREYKQYKEQINTAAEEADSKKVERSCTETLLSSGHRPVTHILFCFAFFPRCRKSWPRQIRWWCDASITRNTMMRNGVPISATYRPSSQTWLSKSRTFRLATQHRLYWYIFI